MMLEMYNIMFEIDNKCGVFFILKPTNNFVIQSIYIGQSYLEIQNTVSSE